MLNTVFGVHGGTTPDALDAPDSLPATAGCDRSSMMHFHNPPGGFAACFYQLSRNIPKRRRPALIRERHSGMLESFGTFLPRPPRYRRIAQAVVLVFEAPDEF